MSVSRTVRRAAAVISMVFVLGAGIGAGAVVFGPSPSSFVGAAVGPPTSTPANPDPPHLRLKGTSTVSEGWSQPFWILLAPSCPEGYHSAGGMVGAIGPLGIAIAANAFTRNEETGIETQGFWINSISGNAIAPGTVFTVYAECVKGIMPA
jgi:hypothetical protein